MFDDPNRGHCMYEPDTIDPVLAFEADWSGVATVHPMTDTLSIDICPVCRHRHRGDITWEYDYRDVVRLTINECGCEVSSELWVMVDLGEDRPVSQTTPYEWHRRRDDR